MSDTDLAARIVRTIDRPSWAKYGIATHDTTGEPRPVNDIFFDAVAVLGKVGDELDRMVVGAELFGKAHYPITLAVGRIRGEFEFMADTVKMQRAWDALRAALAS